MYADLNYTPIIHISTLHNHYTHISNDNMQSAKGQLTLDCEPWQWCDNFGCSNFTSHTFVGM